MAQSQSQLSIRKPDTKNRSRPELKSTIAKGIIVNDTPAPAAAAAPAPAAAAPAPAPAPAAAAAAPAAAAPEPLVPDLLAKILSTKRAHTSTGDANFRIWLFNYLKGLTGKAPKVLQEGCVYVETDPKHTVLFSCHIDTVHSHAESNGGLQSLAYDEAFGHLFLADKRSSGCLGGDDGCGIYIMLRMIEAKVPGRYIFHTGEERGGIGANAVVQANRQMLQDVEAVVAFDRAVRDGENPEVILTQSGQACASVEFGTALCNELNKPEYGFEFPYVVSHKGSFTDSKVYARDVPECVNVACFYNRQHGPDEYVDVLGLEKLVKAAIGVNWSKLPIVRKPTAYGNFGSNKKQHTASGFGNHSFSGMGFEHWEDPAYAPKASKTPTKAAVKLPSLDYTASNDVVDEMDTWKLEDYVDFAESAEMDEVAKLLLKLRMRLSMAETQVQVLMSAAGLE
jgi:hypothetical protein